MNILRLFQYHQKMKFSDIEKELGVRSNKLAYHLKNLTKKGILKKEDNYYSLSETSEYLIPHLSEKRAMLPVVLIFIGNSKECFLYKRNKRPFKDMLSMPGGRPLMTETLGEAVKRMMKEKYNMTAKLSKIHSISVENLEKQNKILQTDIVIFVSAKTKEKIKLTNINKHKKEIISSDYKLIKEDLNKSISIKTIITRKF